MVCRRCGGTVYWIVVRSRRIAMECELTSAPTDLVDGSGVHHAPHCKRRHRDPFMAPEARMGKMAP